MPQQLGMVAIMKVFLTLILLFIVSSRLMNGEVVHITVLSRGYTSVDTTQDGRRPDYQCYRSDPDEDASLSFDRSAPITTDRSPPEDTPHPADPDASYVRVVTFPDTSTWRSEGFGPFYCQASKPGRDVTRVITFFHRSDAKFRSSDGLFTKTVNLNDTAVTITMTSRYEPDDSGNVINWRKDGEDRLTSFDGQTQITFPNPIQTSDQGIYEIYYDNERNKNRGGLYRLIVRECPAGKWGPPECYGICDKCYNGGVCDDKSGLCICPNNFKGSNCLDICRPGGGNRFGYECEIKCTYNDPDPISGCSAHLFCLPDPYGCSCDVGIKGYACNTACDSDEYGPGCSQTCHCASGSSCNRYTGGCSGGCQSGWSGNNCQIPNVCEAGYYGPECTDKCHCLNDAPCDKQTGECPELQCAPGYSVRNGQGQCEECDAGFFGLNCLQSCHCSEACEIVTGRCNGQCLEDWIEPDCQARISRLVSEKVNPYQPSSFTCYVEGNPPPSETSVNLYRYAQGNYDATGITRRSSSVSESERAVVFDVENVYPEEYACNVGDVFISITDNTFVLPVIEGKPVILNTGSTTVRLQWNVWSEGDDVGDPPLVGYDVFMSTDDNWMIALRVDQTTASATVTDLNPETDYSFSIAAVREGLGGVGPRSPEARTTTLCGKPSASPTEVQARAENPQELQLTWKPTSRQSAECRSGVTHYVIYYAPAGSTSTNSVTVSNDTNSKILAELETYLDYTIQMTASNRDEESDKSSKIVKKTLEEVAPAPINVTIPMSTTSSFTVSWSTPLPSNINGNIQKYIIRYQQTAPVFDDNYKMEEVLTGAFDGEHTVTELSPETNYAVEVQTVNGAGSSEWSEPVNATTTSPSANVSSKVSLPIGAVIGGAVGSLLIIVLLIATLIICRRNHPRKPETESPEELSHKTCKSSAEYMNAGYDEHTYQELARSQ